ncbi:MAG: hypothetical protein AB1505_16550 [Candidatus Latescibacterota bacterium]
MSCRPAVLCAALALATLTAGCGGNPAGSRDRGPEPDGPVATGSPAPVFADSALDAAVRAAVAADGAEGLYLGGFPSSSFGASSLAWTADPQGDVDAFRRFDADILALAAHPEAPEAAYVATRQALYRVRRLDPADPAVLLAAGEEQLWTAVRMRLSPVDPALVAVITGGALPREFEWGGRLGPDEAIARTLWLSSDAGQTWTDGTAGVPGEVWDAAFSPTDRRLCVGTTQGVFWVGM